jgi:hypothetical protein
VRGCAVAGGVVLLPASPGPAYALPTLGTGCTCRLVSDGRYKPSAELSPLPLSQFLSSHPGADFHSSCHEQAPTPTLTLDSTQLRNLKLCSAAS